MEFEKVFKIDTKTNIARCNHKGILIENVQDALDMLGNGGQYECSRFMLYKSNLTDEFYNLKSGLAGEILQKFSNYSVRMALIGDFEQGMSERFKEFIYECNQGSQLYFSNDEEKTVDWFQKYR